MALARVKLSLRDKFVEDYLTAHRTKVAIGLQFDSPA